MRVRTVFLILLLVLLIGLTGITTTAALAIWGPFHPGQRLFEVQDWAERRYEALLGTPSGRANYGLTLLDRRISQLEREYGTPDDAYILISISDEIDYVLHLFKDIPSNEETDLRSLFFQDLNTLSALLDQNNENAAGESQFQLAFRSKVQALRTQLEDNSISLKELTGVKIVIDEEPLSSSNDEIVWLINQIDPQKVPFPAGSPGALHLFYPLDGKHSVLDCWSCHPDGVYKSTPNLCTDCHTNDMPAVHYGGQCILCHTTTAWLPSTFEHSVMDTSDCQSCHAVNRPANHYPGQCSACHSTTAWLPASFDHQVAGAVDCQSCHLNQKPANHYSGQCSACHSTNAWRPAGFNHQVAGATDCQACHARPANHFSGQCSMCHSTSTWSGASFNHRFPTNHGNANGQCAKCHPSGGSSWTCYTCHNESEINHKHQEEGISNYAARCLECHADGREHD